MTLSPRAALFSALGLLSLLAGCGKLSGPSMYPSGAMYSPPAGAQADRGQQEQYKHQRENPFFDARSSPLSTVSVDVDTASYSNIRRILRENQLPPVDAVRLEEMVNYFSYDYPAPGGDAPVAIDLDAAACPWAPDHRIVRLGLKARPVDGARLPARNLVFLLDVSGSMSPPNRLPMIVRAMKMLTDQLNERDSVAVVVYAGSSGLVLPPTSGDRKGEIKAALDQLHAGGSTNGGAGIQLAYSVAQQAFKPGGVNRVILASDGDFNVGASSEGELTRLIEEKRKSGVFLTVLGVGEGNVRDANMEALADKGNGNYAYLDGLNEARKVLVQQAGSTLITVAKDVKLQVEFNPNLVQSYRLLGYENRVLDAQDFRNDLKDAGDMGAGHTVTVLYEVVPQGALKPAGTEVDGLKYQATAAPPAAANQGEWLTVKTRYKSPAGDVSKEMATPFTPPAALAPRPDTRFAIAVAEFGLLLRQSEHRGAASYDQVRSALASLREMPDPHGYRAELLGLVDAAARLAAPRGEVAR